MGTSQPKLPPNTITQVAFIILMKKMPTMTLFELQNANFVSKIYAEKYIF